VIGLLILSRQWGFLLLPAVLAFALPLFIWNKNFAFHYVKIICVAVVVGALVGGWFYLHLKQQYGSFTIFNRKTLEFSFANQPLSFYRNTGLGNLLLFKLPTRKTFDNQLFPIFYSEVWGDYWGYFVFVREKTLFGDSANQAEITPYLGRVNFASIIPSIFMITGLIFGLASMRFALNTRTSNPEILTSTLFTMLILSSLAGYMWFLISHPLDSKGVTIKATYMIQVFMILPFLTAGVLEKIRGTRPALYRFTMLLLALVFLHNLPAMITRYWTWLL
jgi:hypothetical protein